MKLYEVVYKIASYSDKQTVARVTASSVVRAAEFISKRKFTGYSGYVIGVTEVFDSVQIAK